MSNSDFRKDATQVISGEAGETLARAATEGKQTLKRHHGDFARGTVHLVLDISVRQPTKKHAAMLHKLIRNRFLFKLLAKVLVFILQLAVFVLKPVVFLLEVLNMFPELGDSFLKDRGTSVFGDQLFNTVEQFGKHGDD